MAAYDITGPLSLCANTSVHANSWEGGGGGGGGIAANGNQRRDYAQEGSAQLSSAQLSSARRGKCKTLESSCELSEMWIELDSQATTGTGTLRNLTKDYLCVN